MARGIPGLGVRELKVHDFGWSRAELVKVYDLAFCVLGVAAFSVLDAFEVFWPFREQLDLQGSVIVGSGLSLSAWVCLYTGLSQKVCP